LICIVVSQLNFKVHRNLSNFDQGLLWHDFTSFYSATVDFKKLLCMNAASIGTILSSLYDNFEVNNRRAGLRGGAILPELCIFLTHRFLFGGSHVDIKIYLGILKSSFFPCMWKTICALC
jgi:hypothetical protein